MGIQMAGFHAGQKTGFHLSPELALYFAEPDAAAEEEAEELPIASRKPAVSIDQAGDPQRREPGPLAHEREVYSQIESPQRPRLLNCGLKAAPSRHEGSARHNSLAMRLNNSSCHPLAKT